MEEESFEVQAKVKSQIPDRGAVQQCKRPEIEMLRTRHYSEYDTYFSFDDPNAGPPALPGG